jgi:serine/threonine-protein kinase
MEPQNPGVLLNLADVVLLQGREEEAAALYRRVLELIEQDPAPTNWQILTIQAQAQAHLGHKSEAVETIQKVLTLENNQAATEAALVYALVGDESSAVVNARRAAAQGIAPSWFALPWFDSLRSSPEFRKLLMPRREPE